TALGGLRHPGIVAVTLEQQLLVPLAELGDAARQGLATLLQLLVEELLLGLDEHQVEVIAEIKTLASPAAQEVDRLQPRDAARPGKETTPVIELVEFLPHDQGRLLEQVVGIIQITRQEMNVAVQAGLNRAEVGGKLSLPCVCKRLFHRSSPPGK